MDKDHKMFAGYIVGLLNGGLIFTILEFVNPLWFAFLLIGIIGGLLGYVMSNIEERLT